LHVCLFEKRDRTGGTFNGGMGPFGAGTHIQAKYGVKNCTTKDAFNYLMDFTHWQVDARLASEYINNTAFTVKWLEEKGVIFRPMEGERGGGFIHSISPHPDYKTDAKGMYITMLLTDRVKADKNIRVFMETSVQKLVKTGENITGLVARDKNGQEKPVNARAVIIFTGGFMGSPELIEKYTTYTYKKDLFYTFEMPHITGDGIRMAWDAGAAWSEMMIDAYKGMPIYGGPSGTKNEWSIIANPNLMVNLQGERFVNENAERVYMANAIHRQPEGCAFLMFDSTIADIYRANGPGTGPDNSVTIADVDVIVAEAKKLNYPYLYAAESLEDLCRQTGVNLDSLKKTVAEYNSYCRAGNDPIFYKEASNLLPLKGPRYYASKFCCDSWGGLGGIKINHKTEVLNKALKPIPGLYSGGSDANSIYAGTYPSHLSCNTTGFAYTTGLMAARSAAEYIKALG
jgi:fumarate reductase flavoprotein subunit